MLEGTCQEHIKRINPQPKEPTMLALSLNPTELAYLQAIDDGRRPTGSTSWNLAVTMLKHLASIGLIAFRDGLVAYSNEIKVTSLGRTTLEMKRDGDFDKVEIGGISWYNFYY